MDYFAENKQKLYNQLWMLYLCNCVTIGTSGSIIRMAEYRENIKHENC